MSSSPSRARRAAAAGRAAALPCARPPFALRGGVALAFSTLLAACGPGLRPIAGAPSPSRARVAAPIAAAAAGSDAEYLRGRELMVPVEGVGPERLHASDFDAPRGGGRTHHALDILAPRGTPVLATDDGTILRVHENTLGGLTVYLLDQAQRFVYYYAHLDHYRDGLRAGMPVARGDVLGYVGTTGNAPENVPHLHFQAMRYQPRHYWEGKPVNPEAYLILTGSATAATITATERR